MRTKLHLNAVHKICIAVLVGFVLLACETSVGQVRDNFYWLGEINKASVVMLAEQDIVSKRLGQQIADAVANVLAEGSKPGAIRSGDYLAVERSLIAFGGPEMTHIHSGRSRQDIGATFRRFFLRDDLLQSFEKLIEVREVLLTTAEAHRDAIVPAYTWGVQAQPISFGHYLGAYVQALSRTADRYREAWQRVNQSPLGSAALGTSSFPINRPRLAELLGFDGNLENSLDANQISPVDTGMEMVSIASSSALSIGMLIADITTQYSQSKPWLILEEGNLTGGSSIMPQKRNPMGLVMLRMQASEVIGESMTYFIQSHNVMHGMGDYKGDTPNQVLQKTARLYGSLANLLQELRFDEKRALDEVNGDYATTTELANTLQRDADVPFRVGHHFASELVSYGRSHDLKPGEIPYREAQKIYAESAGFYEMDNVQLPLSEEQFHKSLSAENMVVSAKVLGGPQPAEVQRMLSEQRKYLQSDRAWLDAIQAKLKDASDRLEAAFIRLREGNW